MRSGVSMLLPQSLLMFLVVAAALAMVPASNCPDKCGNVNISYPFGIGKGCFREGFDILCIDDTGGGIYKPYINNIEVINLSIVPAQARVYKYIAYACYDKLGNPNNAVSSADIDLRGSPYRLSNTRNKFTAIGCRTLAYIKDLYASNGWTYMSGCLSICQNMNSVTNGAQCNGMGCCQTSIPKGLQYYKVTFDERFNHSYVWKFNPCSYAFVADEEWYVFNSSDVYEYEVYYRNKKRVPIVLDWAIGTETCEQAKGNSTAVYACVSENSYCLNSANGPGYTCNCSDGYQGNPYTKGGCQDINECEDQMHHQCYGNCTNFPGGFNCSCPQGTQGDPKSQGGCQDDADQQPKVSVLVKILIER